MLRLSEPFHFLSRLLSLSKFPVCNMSKRYLLILCIVLHPLLVATTVNDVTFVQKINNFKNSLADNMKRPTNRNQDETIPNLPPPKLYIPPRKPIIYEDFSKNDSRKITPDDWKRKYTYGKIPINFEPTKKRSRGFLPIIIKKYRDVMDHISQDYNRCVEQLKSHNGKPIPFDHYWVDSYRDPVPHVFPIAQNGMEKVDLVPQRDIYIPSMMERKIASFCPWFTLERLKELKCHYPKLWEIIRYDFERFPEGIYSIQKLKIFLDNYLNYYKHKLNARETCMHDSDNPVSFENLFANCSKNKGRWLNPEWLEVNGIEYPYWWRNISKEFQEVEDYSKVKKILMNIDDKFCLSNIEKLKQEEKDFWNFLEKSHRSLPDKVVDYIFK